MCTKILTMLKPLNHKLFKGEFAAVSVNVSPQKSMHPDRVASEYVHEPQDLEVMGFSWPNDRGELKGEMVNVEAARCDAAIICNQHSCRDGF